MRKSQLRKIIREVIKKELLITEQSSQTTCQFPILRRCSRDKNGQIVSNGGYCRLYSGGCITDQNFPNPSYLEVGDCFAWTGSSTPYIECITGFVGTASSHLARASYSCPDCDGSDINGNGIEDCYDCDGAPYNGGCMNCPTCLNYNPLATTDDGTCFGCTDPTMLNYNPGSSIDDGSCVITFPDTYDCLYYNIFQPTPLGYNVL